MSWDHGASNGGGEWNDGAADTPADDFAGGSGDNGDENGFNGGDGEGGGFSGDCFNCGKSGQVPLFIVIGENANTSSDTPSRTARSLQSLAHATTVSDNRAFRFQLPHSTTSFLSFLYSDQKEKCHPKQQLLTTRSGGEEGHSKADCTNERVEREFTGQCRLCEETGHRVSTSRNPHLLIYLF